MKIKILLLVLACAGAVGAGFYFLIFSGPSADNTAVSFVDELFGWKYPVAKFPAVGLGSQIAYSDIREPGRTPQGLPVRLKIPIIGVDSAIEDAVITPDGRMDVPSGSVNVAWFSLGPHPGQVGSAVIGGHFGINEGVKFVFYDLDKLKVGDQVYIIDDKGNELGFVVRSIGLFDSNADAETVFTSEDGIAHLNLITCEGIWNKIDDTYPLRRVVFTDALPAGDSAGAIFTRSLTVGDRGADVSALQAALVAKGLLSIPSEVPRGYFGSLTRAAVMQYQASVGLPLVGIFGPLTRARLTSESKI